MWMRIACLFFFVMDSVAHNLLHIYFCFVFLYFIHHYNTHCKCKCIFSITPVDIYDIQRCCKFLSPAPKFDQTSEFILSFKWLLDQINNFSALPSSVSIKQKRKWKCTVSPNSDVIDIILWSYHIHLSLLPLGHVGWWAFILHSNLKFGLQM